MAESTLSLTYTQLENNVARKLGWPQSTDAARTADETARLGEIVAAGQRMFMAPPWQDASLPMHRWSFVKLDTTITTVASTRTVDCPDLFGFLVTRELLYASSDDSPFHGVTVTTADHIHTLTQEDDDEEEKPEWVAIRPQSFTAATGQRFEAVFSPIPDDAYALTFPYAILADAASGSEHFRGGMLHVETLKAACRAVAEHEDEDMQGIEWGKFLSCLRASFAVDIRQSPQNFGQWGDSDTRRKPQRTAEGIVHSTSIETTYPT